MSSWSKANTTVSSWLRAGHLRAFPKRQPFRLPWRSLQSRLDLWAVRAVRALLAIPRLLVAALLLLLLLMLGLRRLLMRLLSAVMRAAMPTPPSTPTRPSLRPRGR